MNNQDASNEDGRLDRFFAEYLKLCNDYGCYVDRSYQNAYFTQNLKTGEKKYFGIEYPTCLNWHKRKR